MLEVLRVWNVRGIKGLEFTPGAFKHNTGINPTQ